MSKIEKALSRSLSERHLALVPTGGPAAKASERRDLVAAPSELEARARSSAAIALMREPKVRGRNELAEARIIFPEMGESPTVKAFREIRTKILQKTAGNNCVVMITAVRGQSGTTFVALNLSAAFAFDVGKTALLIDCNLRNPRLHRLFTGEEMVGLTDYLENPELDLAEIIHAVGIERLRVIPAGGRRETPAEYFTSIKMKRLLDDIRGRYPERFIILDSPPMTESADTQILSDLCDYVVLVVPYGEVTRSQIDACVKGIDRNKLLGVVFNNEPQFPKFGRKR
ncbi:polysaccharide biosynthesis protein [Sulfurifustis variabilis]|uniref:Polysaccharide biosynthesis protein n=1 Tax=Sulfurifustis variabilis TaxID=1675686 RepID=A0A1B4V2W7_9GAMM|nr:polysaccharide biosynthesis tyrosine autokinase [Sulfurifustis variabilis]BAU47900.1 polysaccharide biosynthesis protein [Sulfurifustis variabilis]